MRPIVDDSICIGCGACYDVCPVEPKVMELREIKDKGMKSIIVNPEVCDF